MTCCPTCGQPILRGISLDYTGRRLLIGDSEIHLTGREADILTVLLAKPGVYIAKESIVVKVWGGVAELEDAVGALSVHMCLLRKKLKGTPIHIRNSWGSGYALMSA